MKRAGRAAATLLFAAAVPAAAQVEAVRPILSAPAPLTPAAPVLPMMNEFAAPSLAVPSAFSPSAALSAAAAPSAPPITAAVAAAVSAPAAAPSAAPVAPAAVPAALPALTALGTAVAAAPAASALGARFDGSAARVCAACAEDAVAAAAGSGAAAPAVPPAPSAGRLGKDARPERYDLRLALDPEAGTFRGQARVAVRVAAPTERLVLHALDLSFDAVSVGGRRLDAARVVVDAAAETVTLLLDAPLKKGRVELDFAYSGKMNELMRGLYKARGRDGANKEEAWTFTHLEPTHARRVLPSFDEPEFKAPFRLTLDVPEHLTPISNMPARSTTVADGRKVVTFAESPKMSSYLLAVYAARLVPRSRKVGKTVITVWAAADQIDQTDFALDAAVNALKGLNRYFGIPYRLPKLDLVAAPDFASGAMENWGAILFRDSNLLIDPKLSSEAMKRRVAEVVTHEIVHQWFGNLVTMKWWNDLWLNEAFATWLAAKIVDQWKPEWRVWDDFDGGKRQPLAIDALPGTRPVRSNAATPAEIQAMFDPITYQKAGALLRMLEGYAGERAFRAAVRAYIRRYQYGNAEAGDLGRELERASGRPVKNMMDGWLQQAGAPRVSVSAGGPGGRTLTLSQERFSADASAAKDATLWSVPVAVRYRLKGETKTREARVVLNAASQTLRLPGRGELLWAYPNAGETGYYRLALSPGLLQSALAHKDELAPVERAGLLNHLWAAVRAGALPAARFLDALAVYKGDSSRLVIEDAAGYLKSLAQQLAPDAASREKLREYVAKVGDEKDPYVDELRRQLERDDRHAAAVADFAADFFAPTLARLGWDKKPGEKPDAGLARAAALNALVLLAPQSVPAAEIDARLASYLKDPASIDAALAPVVVVAAARRNDPKLFAEFRARLAAPKTPEQKTLMLRALAEFSAPELLDQYLAMTLSSEIRAQDAWMPYAPLLGNPATQARSWEFVKAHWGELVAKVGPRGATRIVAAAGGLISADWRKDVETFFRDPKNEVEMARATLAQALDAIDLGLRFRQGQAGSFQEWVGLRADAPRLSRAGFKAFDRIAELWSLSAAERAALLGVSASAYAAWKSSDAPVLTPAALERVSLALGVYRRLNELMGGPAADGWVKRPNKAFDGKPALDLMTSPDSRDLRRVRDYLAGVGGGWL